MYECTETFAVPLCDCCGFETDEVTIIEAGSLWEKQDGHFRVIDGEILLENPKHGWLEISVETFNRCFKPIEECEQNEN